METSANAPARVIHFLPDDKFLDAAIALFEACAPGRHDYAMYNRSSASEVVYVRSLDKMLFAPFGSPCYQKIIEDCRQGRYAAMIVHSFPERLRELIQAVRGHAKIAVFTWGHDIYYFINKREYLPETRAIRRLSCMDGKFGFLKSVYRGLRQDLTTNRWFPVDRSLRAFLSVDYIVPVIDEDYLLFASKFHRFPLPRMLPFSYGSTDATFAVLGDSLVDDECILVNNSATSEGNHVDILQKLKEIGVQNRLVVPLNYGNPVYGTIVRDRGRELFGERFKSLDIFMEFNRYLCELRHCRYAVMGHRRQQAVGNVVTALLLGAKVFFLKDSPVYRFFVKQGAYVFVLETAVAEDFRSPLNEQAVAVNRAIVARIWGREPVLERTRNLLSTLGIGGEACVTPQTA